MPAIRFEGVRVRYDSTNSYDELLAALLADIGERPVPINDIATTTDTWESYRERVEPYRWGQRDSRSRGIAIWVAGTGWCGGVIGHWVTLEPANDQARGQKVTTVNWSSGLEQRGRTSCQPRAGTAVMGARLHDAPGTVSDEAV